MKRSREIKIHDKYWYILEFTNLLKVRVLRYYFVNKPAAERCIRYFFPYRTKMFRVVRGSKVANYIDLQGPRSKIGLFSKYDYPIERSYSFQSLKSYRTQYRRRLRRMGLLVKIKPSVRFDREPPKGVYVKNTQKVAKCPRTAAKVFRLEHRPPFYFYILIKKYKSQREDSICKVKVLRYSAKTGAMKIRKFHIKNTYILIPYLIWDVENAIHEKIKANPNKLSYYSRFGFKVYESEGK